MILKVFILLGLKGVRVTIRFDFVQESQQDGDLRRATMTMMLTFHFIAVVSNLKLEFN